MVETLIYKQILQLSLKILAMQDYNTSTKKYHSAVNFIDNTDLSTVKALLLSSHNLTLFANDNQD